MTLETNNSNQWVCARLNYNEPWVEFLTKSLKPFMETVTKTRMVERYFWERSYEDGAHIKLYFRCKTELKDTLLIPTMRQHFEQYIADKPSFRRKNLPHLAKNNSVQFFDYQPNIEQWGGEVGMPIAERHFQSSSNAVLEFMAASSEDWSSDTILATAIEMHLAFAESADMDTEEATRFFEYCLLYHATEDFRIQYFEEFFEMQQEPLIGFHADLWEGLQTRSEYKELLYNDWKEQCFYTSADIIRTFRLRVLKIEAKFSAIWTMYAKLLHKTNNRLGLHGKDESLVFYLMMRSLEKMGTENLKMKNGKF
jgi:thiopeptide-type bacteriocin biosynthesis protein